MPDEYVLDSSIIAAIFFPEEASSRAVRAVQDRELITVDLAMTEVANVAWKRVTLFDEEEKLIKEALKKSVEFINTACHVLEARYLLEISFEIALREKITVYDALFLAATETEGVPLLTLDKRLEKTAGTVELL